ncbi:MAG TPA: cupredoxin domain-containing protein [Nitrososphaerales archaeon]|nr:cupredoxin domain-containing protein [Nitrososphaerales archaeon]
MSTRSSSAVGVIVAVLIIGAVAGIGYYQVVVAPTLKTSTSTSPTVTCPSSACVNVTMPNIASTPPNGYTSGSKTTFGYTPDTITIVIGKNNTIVWINNDAAIHTATSDTTGVGAFSSGDITAGASAQLTFTTAGTFTYHCKYHAWMQGTVIVKAA